MNMYVLIEFGAPCKSTDFILQVHVVMTLMILTDMFFFMIGNFSLLHILRYLYFSFENDGIFLFYLKLLKLRTYGILCFFFNFSVKLVCFFRSSVDLAFAQYMRI